MILKDGVSIDKITMPMREAATTIAECYAAFGAECVVTSGDEPETLHKGRPIAGDTRNPHYEGKALDFRLWNVPPSVRAALVMQITETLDPECVVLWEIGPHLVRYLGRDHWSVTCLASDGRPEVMAAPIPDACARCGKAIQGSVPHLHCQIGHVEHG